jgi:hypothetical protein
MDGHVALSITRPRNLLRVCLTPYLQVRRDEYVSLILKPNAPKLKSLDSLSCQKCPLSSSMTA